LPSSSRCGLKVRGAPTWPSQSSSPLLYLAIVFFAKSESILRQDVDELADDVEAYEDVEDGEELAEYRGERKVSQTDGDQRHHAEVNGVQYAPLLHDAVEDRPARQEADRKEDENAKLFITPPSAPERRERS
jgi:hypothetical protein